jgi:hypothetical protein
MEIREATGTRWFRIPTDLWRLILQPDHYPAAEASRDRERMPAGMIAISHRRGEKCGMPLALAVEGSFMVLRARL